MRSGIQYLSHLGIFAASAPLPNLGMLLYASFLCYSSQKRLSSLMYPFGFATFIGFILLSLNITVFSCNLWRCYWLTFRRLVITILLSWVIKVGLALWHSPPLVWRLMNPHVDYYLICTLLLSWSSVKFISLQVHRMAGETTLPLSPMWLYKKYLTRDTANPTTSKQRMLAQGTVRIWLLEKAQQSRVPRVNMESLITPNQHQSTTETKTSTKSQVLKTQSRTRLMLKLTQWVLPKADPLLNRNRMTKLTGIWRVTQIRMCICCLDKDMVKYLTRVEIRVEAIVEIRVESTARTRVEITVEIIVLMMRLGNQVLDWVVIIPLDPHLLGGATAENMTRGVVKKTSTLIQLMVEEDQ